MDAENYPADGVELEPGRRSPPRTTIVAALRASGCTCEHVTVEPWIDHGTGRIEVGHEHGCPLLTRAEAEAN